MKRIVHVTCSAANPTGNILLLEYACVAHVAERTIETLD